MIGPTDQVRLSLLLPVPTPRALFAASQVVLFVLAYARVEIDLVRYPGESRRIRGPGSPGSVLFVAANLDWAASNIARTGQFERDLRARIMRHYTRQGITPVDYELQLL